MRRQAPDFFLFLAAVALTAVGVVMVFSSTTYAALLSHHDPFFYLKRQGMWALIALAAMLFAGRLDYFRLERWANSFLLFSFFLLGLVLATGLASKGAVRWLGVGSVTFQPSELVKLALVFYLARSLSRKQDRLASFRQGLLPPLIMLGVAAGLILAQPDLGTAIILAGTTYLMFFAAGARPAHLALLAALGLVAALVAIVGEEYRMERLLAFLNPEADPSDTGFQTIQSLLALGSGRLFGVGLGFSRQKFLYVPERHTDFIFAILGEELGFVGCLAVLLLLFLLIWRGMRAALLAPDNFGRLLACGLTSMLAFQALINLGVVTGTLPVTGITLPFLSYGGSSLLVSMVAVGVLLNISRYSLAEG
ncbi:MAG: putative lipid II flippase FtsW [Moorellales bacterium]